MTRPSPTQQQDEVQHGDKRLRHIFWRNTRVNEETGCWEWTRWLSKQGYGLYGGNNAGRNSAYRYAYLRLVGPVAPGLHLDHLCRVRHCVNPNHLEPVTPHENSRRGNSWNWIKARTHCPHGHPYDAENTKINGNGHRQCKACIKAAAPAHAAYARKWRQRRKEMEMVSES